MKKKNTNCLSNSQSSLIVYNSLTVLLLKCMWIIAVLTFADRGRVAPPRGAPRHTADSRLSQELIALMAGEMQHLSRLVEVLLGAQRTVGWSAWVLAGFICISCTSEKHTFTLHLMLSPPTQLPQTHTVINLHAELLTLYIDKYHELLIHFLWQMLHQAMSDYIAYPFTSNIVVKWATTKGVYSRMHLGSLSLHFGPEESRL